MTVAWRPSLVSWRPLAIVGWRRSTSFVLKMLGVQVPGISGGPMTFGGGKTERMLGSELYGCKTLRPKGSVNRALKETCRSPQIAPEGGCGAWPEDCGQFLHV